MKKGFVSFLCFLSIIFQLSFARGEGYGVEVRSTSSELLEVEPGRIVTGSFLIYNNLEREEEFIEQLKLPQGWQEIVSDQFPLKLKSKEQIVKVVAFLVPQTSPGGDYQIRYSVTNQMDYNITDTDSIQVVVLPVIKMEILEEKRPEVVMAGETYQADFYLFNKSNDSIKVKLQIKSTPTFPAELKPEQITLDPGKSKVIQVGVKTDEKLKKSIKNFLEIKAETENSKGEIISVRKSISVAIIPRVAEEFDPYHKLPLKASLIGVGQDGKNGFQSELSGYGTLDEEGKRSLDFLFRGPDTQHINKLGKRDEYRLSYRHGNLHLHFGDRSYSLSPLTERFSYGRGVEANFRSGKFGLGAFYLKTRWGEPKKKEGGVSINYQFGEKLGIKGNLLNKRKGSTPDFKGYDEQVYSIQATIRPVETINLELEFGYCDNDQENKLDNLAFRMDLHGQFSDQVRYSLEKIYAQPEYFGYYKDVDYTTGSITFPIYRSLRGDLSYRIYENNLDLDSTKGIANQEKSRQAGIFYSFPFGIRFSLKYKELTREDQALPANFEYEEKVLDLGLVHNFGKLSLSTHIERGEFEDRLSSQSNDNLERYSLFATFRPSRSQSYNFFTRIGHNSFTQHPEYTKSAGISAIWYFKDNISLNLNYRRDKGGSEKNLVRDDLFSLFNYTLKNKHSLVIRTQWSKYQQRGKGEFSFLLMYTIPLKIPVSKKKSIGVLRGRVFDQEKPESPPIPKVILTANGKTALTNQKGEFIFASLTPGIYYLRVEKSSIGLDRIALRKQPVITEVEGGKTTEIEIGVATSCRISGRVAVFAPDSDKSSRQKDTSIILSSTTSPNGMEKIYCPELKQPEPFIKLLETNERISVSPDTSFVISCFKGSEKREYFSGKEVFLKADSEGISISEGEEDKLEDKIKRVVFIPKNKKSRFNLNGKDHRGILEVLFSSENSSLLALNWLREEDYLEQEVPLEMGNQSSSEFEDLIPQMITASSESLLLLGPDEEEKLEKDDMSEGKGLGNTLVEIVDGEEVLQQLTDEKGRFSFEDIRPGEWRLKVDDQELPVHHYLEHEEYQVELKPGEQKEITVKVLPRLRPIQIIDEGKIEQENK
jgi:predicted porin